MQSPSPSQSPTRGRAAQAPADRNPGRRDNLTRMAHASVRGRTCGRAVVALAVGGLLLGCDRPAPVATKSRHAAGRPPAAGQPTAAGPSAADGQGTLELHGPRAVPAGGRASWEIVYTAGPLGVATGGGVLFQVSPFWGWSPPQTEAPAAEGHVGVTTSGSARLEVEVGDLGYAIARVMEGRVAAGESVTFAYGPARADRFAEKEERFYVKVDGDGDGFFAPVTGYPLVETLPGEAARLLATASSFTGPDGAVRLTVAALDAMDDRATGYRGTVRLEATGASFDLPPPYTFDEHDAGAHTFELHGATKDSFRIEVADDAGGLAALSNPIAPGPFPTGHVLLWGDLHGHSNLSDGTGTPEDYYAFARAVAALDVAALTDHDAHGLWALDERPELWDRIRAAARRAYEPGRFVTFAGYEWTSWTFGHRHVLFGRDDDAPLFSMRAPATSTPEGLWAALAGHDAITIPHHPAGGPVPIDWDHHDPRFEPVVEITSIHGCSEAYGVARMIYHPVRGAFVRDALARGYRLGLIGSGDTHNGHPGLGDPAAPTSGLAGILATGTTREAVLEAIRKRHVFATSGARIPIVFSVEGALMGEEITIATGKPAAYEGRVWATDRLEKVEVIRNGEVIAVAHPTATEVRITGVDPAPPPSGYYYLRATQFDEQQAWSSPVFFEARD